MMPDDGPGTSYKYVGSESKRRPDGWETTGDLGAVDREGYLFLTDRRCDMIVTGGANVYPAEVEAVLDEYPGVVTSAVIGLPDDEYGSRIHAIVETNTELDVARLTEWVRSRLVAYKIPRSFEFVSGPLRSDAGKLRRSALREERLIRTR
jgi:bile acid-coenzyme A ligase